MNRTKFIISIFILSLFISHGFAQTMVVDTLGNVQSIKKEANYLVIKTQGATAHVSVYSPSVIRINISRKPEVSGLEYAVIKSPVDFNYNDDNKKIVVQTAQVKLVINKAPLRFYFYTADGKPLSGDYPLIGTTWQNAQVNNYRTLYAGERFIGLGEKTGNLDRHGQTYVNWNTDAGNNGPYTDPLYKTYPFFIGLHDGLTYGIFFDNTNKSYFDFGAPTDDKIISFGADGGDINYYFFSGQNISGIIKDYSWLTGRMEMPPLWSLGYQQCRYSYGTEKELLEVAQTFRKHQIPADVVYCDIDYMDGYKIFTWNKNNFPDPKGMIDQLKAMNFHLVNIVDPGIKVDSSYDKYREGLASHYFGTYPNGTPYTGAAWPGRVHFPNFTDSGVRSWWGKSFTVLTKPGVEGFWNDMNEPSSWGQAIPPIVQFGKYGYPEVKNIYGMQMARATYEGTKQLLGNKRPFVLTRAAYAGTQRYSAVWTGDNAPYDEHMLLGQRLVNTLGLAGTAFVGVDIGGFSGMITTELMVPWNSLGVYTPMFRNHSSVGTEYREPWRFGKQNEEIIKKGIEERYRLLPYLYAAFYEAHTTGMPVARSLAINYTNDSKIYDTKYQNQFLFGDNILVAPVISKADVADVYLPEGQWYKASTEELYTGQKNYTVKAPLTDLPVFIKAGAIIPKQHVIQSTNEPGDGVLELHIWNGNQGSIYTYYEDDGQTYNYEHGAFYTRTIRFDPAKKTVVLNAVTGSFSSKYTTIQLVMHGFNNLDVLKVNGKKITGKIFSNSKAPITVTY